MRIYFEHIRMSFGANEVLHDVSLEIAPGTIFALIGENGAGKSTLMNILGGLFPPASGTIYLDGEKASFASPNDSIAHGIAFIHQELCPVNDLAVYENIFIGREYKRAFGLLDRKRMKQEAKAILDDLQMAIPVDAPMSQLDASSKQVVAIARALLCNAKVIIMDEPTTSLTEHEISRLFELIRRLSAQGVTIIFISHKLNEIKELCSHYAVLRNGTLVANGQVQDVTTKDLSEFIVGHELSAWNPPDYASCDDSSPVRLSCCNLCDSKHFHDISFEARAGEILGFTGLLGSGQSELFRAIFGDMPGYTGQLTVCGRDYHAKNTAQAIAAGIGFVPSNRKENAIVPDLSVLANGTLAAWKQFSHFGIIDRKTQTHDFQENISSFHLKCADSNDYITTLSGGNQQKVILARWLEMNPSILVLDNPTQGVDIGAKQEIYEIIRQIAAKGVAVIVLSGEGQEIQRLCHRTLVMFHGKIAGELTGHDITEQAIMALATGATQL